MLLSDFKKSETPNGFQISVGLETFVTLQNYPTLEHLCITQAISVVDPDPDPHGPASN
jgi:hypothetical protein